MGAFPARLAGLALLLVAAASTAASAQDGNGFVGGAVVQSVQRAGLSDSAPDHSRPGVGGSAAGLVLTAGLRLAPWLALAGEFSEPARLQQLQELHYFYVQGFDTRHRDVIISALAHVKLSGSGAVSLEPLGGFSVVRVDTLRAATRSSPCCLSVAELGPYGDFKQAGHTSWGVTFGGDVAVRVSRHVSVVPQMRIHWIKRSLNDWHELGLSRYVFRTGVGVRATF